MPDSFANLLLQITGESGDARRTLREVGDDITEFGHKRASAEIGVDGIEQARAKLDTIQEKLAELRGKDIKVDIDVSRVQERIATIRTNLENALKSGNSNELSRAFNDASRLGRDFTRVLQDSEVHLRGLDRVLVGVASGVRQLFTDPGKALSAGLSTLAAGAGSVTQAIGTGLVSALQGLAGAAVSGLAGIAPLAIGIGALVPIVIALVGVLGGATAALGGLAVAFGAILGPAVLVAVAAFKVLGTVFQQASLNPVQLAQQQHALANAYYQQAQSAQAVANAQLNLQQVTVEASHAERDAILGVRDAQLALQSAQLGEQSANLQYQQSVFDLQKLRRELGLTGEAFNKMFQKFQDVDFQPGNIGSALSGVGRGDVQGSALLALEHAVLAVKEARLGQSTATNQATHATNNLSDAQQKANQFQQQGLNAYPGYRSAVQGLAAANHQLAESYYAIQKAQQALTNPTGEMTGFQQRLATQLRSILHSLEDAFNPVIEPVLRGIASALQDFAQVVEQPGVHDALIGLGRAIGELFAAWGRWLSTREFAHDFIRFTNAMSGLLVALTPALSAFSTLLLRLATAALPFLTSALRSGLGAFTDWSRGHAHAHDLTQKMRGAMHDLGLVLGLVGGLFRVFAAAMRDLRPSGEKLLGGLIKDLNKLAVWLGTQQGRSALQTYFNDALDVVNAVITAIGYVVDAIKWIIDHRDDFASVFGFINDNFIKPTKEFLGLLGSLFGAIGGIGGGGGPGGGSAASGAFNALKDIVGTIWSLMKSINSVLGGFPAATLAWIGVLAVAARHWKTIGAPIRSLGRGLERLLPGKLGKAAGGIFGANSDGMGAARTQVTAADTQLRAAEMQLEAARGGGGPGGGGGGKKGKHEPGGGGTLPGERTPPGERRGGPIRRGLAYLGGLPGRAVRALGRALPGAVRRPLLAGGGALARGGRGALGALEGGGRLGRALGGGVRALAAIPGLDLLFAGLGAATAGGGVTNRAIGAVSMFDPVQLFNGIAGTNVPSPTSLLLKLQAMGGGDLSGNNRSEARQVVAGSIAPFVNNTHLSAAQKLRDITAVLIHQRDIYAHQTGGMSADLLRATNQQIAGLLRVKGGYNDVLAADARYGTIATNNARRAAEQAGKVTAGYYGQVPAIEAALASIKHHTTGVQRNRDMMDLLIRKRDQYASDTSSTGQKIERWLNAEIDSLSRTKGGQEALRTAQDETRRRGEHDAHQLARAWQHVADVINQGLASLSQNLAANDIGVGGYLTGLGQVAAYAATHLPSQHAVRHGAHRGAVKAHGSKYTPPGKRHIHVHLTSPVVAQDPVLTAVNVANIAAKKGH